MLWPGRGDSRKEAAVLEAAERSVKMRAEQDPLDPSVTCLGGLTGPEARTDGLGVRK